MRIVFDQTGWEEYLFWQQEDRKILKRINELIKDILRYGNEGIGKPEPLRFGLAGYWSRRITEEHRLIYRIAEDTLIILSCRGHYK